MKCLGRISCSACNTFIVVVLKTNNVCVCVCVCVYVCMYVCMYAHIRMCVREGVLVYL